MKIHWMLLLLVPLLGFLDKVLGLSDCPTSLCTCHGEDILCSNKGLRAIPTFTHTAVKYRNIYLDNNRISTIYSYDFANLATFDEFHIVLSKNVITVIQDGAFSKLGNVSLRLELFSNDKQFDNFLRNLTVKELFMDRVTALDVTTMFALGSSLETLNLGMEKMSEWPQGLKPLRHLKYLFLTGIQMTAIPDSAFHGLENSLLSLTIKDSSLKRLPDAVCFLKNVMNVFFVGRQTPGSSALAPHCEKPLTSVDYLLVDDCRLTDFPQVFHVFPTLSNLIITGNPSLRYIRDSDLPNNMLIKSLNLSSNGFRQVPYAIRRLHTLTDLDLSYNEISTIEGNDFTGLPPIARLVLTGNPIDYLSPEAFVGVPQIKILDLRHTNLTTIPRAILSLNSSSSVDLRDNQIECSCDLAWIKTWAKTFSDSIVGNCFFSTESISLFISRDLNDC